MKALISSGVHWGRIGFHCDNFFIFKTENTGDFEAIPQIALSCYMKGPR
jgi:hypothetical protein